MEFDEIVVKESPGLCRCCLSEGCYKDMGTEYTWMNENEVYADMLLECFDIGISQHNEGPNGPNRLICEVCITRLRDACNFKKQVLDSEKKFIDMIGRGEFRPKVLIYQAQMKAETEDIATNEVEYLDDDMDFGDADDDLPLKQPDEEPSVSEDITVSTLPVKNKRGRPRKTVVKTEKKAKLAKAEARTSKAIVKGDSRGGQKTTQIQDSSHKNIDAELKDKCNTNKINDIMVELPGKSKEENYAAIVKKQKTGLTAKEKRKIMRSNVVQVLIKTTAMPFRWLKSSYRCFYCYNIYQEPSDLKNHQEAHIGDEIKEQAMNNYWESVVYIDVSNLACKLCTEKVDDLYDMIDHLVAKHGVVYNKDVGTCMVAFKLDNVSLNCLVCGAIFYSFGPLLHHTNKDHKGTSVILCDICGQNFKGANLLRLHIKTVHENIGVLCPECGVKFETRSKLKTHQKNQHEMEKKFKCLVCDEVFQSHYKRSRHMVTEHKNRKEIKCLHCPKTFVFRSMMMTHLRDAHLKVRNHVCGVCGWKAFSSNRLKNHMYKHSGEKKFKCAVCDKAFSTNKIMKAHFLRLHSDTRPHAYVGHQH